MNQQGWNDSRLEQNFLRVVCPIHDFFLDEIELHILSFSEQHLQNDVHSLKDQQYF